VGILDAPHDTFFGLLFQRPEVAADWLRSVLPTRVARAIAWRTFVRAPDRSFSIRLRRNEADRVFVARLRRGNGRVVWVLEHKAERDADLGSQTLRYAVDLRHGMRRRPSAPEPLVVVAVLHHGRRPWRAARHPHLARLPMRAGDALDALQPRTTFVVDDLASQDERVLLARRLMPTRFLRHCTGRQVLAAVDRWAGLLREARRRHGVEVVHAVTMYALAVSDVRPKPLAERISRILYHPEDIIMSTLQRIYSRGKVAGRAEGRAEGKAEGETTGRAMTLLRLLRKRFGTVPTAISRRIRSAPAADLERWIDRIFDATSIREVVEPTATAALARASSSGVRSSAPQRR
jgi:predicted transposase YdaD